MEATDIGEWLTKGLSEGAGSKIGEAIIGLILTGSKTENEKVLAQIKTLEGEFDLLHDVMEEILKNQELDKINLAYRNLQAKTDSLITATDMSSALSDQNQAITTLLDVLTKKGAISDYAGCYTLANAYFNNMAENTTSVCEYLFRNLNLIWNLLAHALYQRWSVAKDAQLENIADGVLDYLPIFNAKRTMIQGFVNELNQRVFAIGAAVVNMQDSETRKSIFSAFTWFGLPTPDTQNWDDQIIEYTFNWGSNATWGPKGMGYIFDTGMKGFAGVTTEPLGTEFFGFEKATVPANSFAKGMVLAQYMGNTQVVPVLSDGSKWYSEPNQVPGNTITIYNQADGGNSDWKGPCAVFNTGFMEFGPGEYLTGWQNDFSWQNNQWSNIKGWFYSTMHPTVFTNLGQYTCEGQTKCSKLPEEEGGWPFYNQNMVGPINENKAGARITGVCFGLMGNRWGYMAQNNVNLNNFGEPFFGGATSAQDIEAYFKNN